MNILYFSFFFICSLISLYLVQKISIKYNFYDLPDKKKIHKKKVTKSAGLALIPIILLNIVIFEYNFYTFYFLLFLICVIFLGFIDDIINLAASKKLLILFLLLSFFVIEILRIDTLGYLFNREINLNIFSIPFTILCLLLIINSFNYFDGLDGLLGSLTIISVVYFLYFAQGQLAIFLLSVLIYLTIFLFFNFGILPKQFMGDSGSLGLGFIVSFLAIYSSQIEKSIMPSFIIWPLAFFVYEFLLINLIRIKIKKNIFSRDLNFIFNILAHKHGNLNSVIICICIQIFFCFHGIFLEKFDLNNLSIILFCFYFIVYLILRIIQFNKYYKKTKHA